MNMQLLKRAKLAEAQRDALLAAGAPLANAAYNLAQMPRLDDGTRNSLDASRRRWDHVVATIHEANASKVPA